jgi:hypothetical protein
MCECQACDAPADWSVWLHAWLSRPAGPKFMCQTHKDIYTDPTPIPGIDRPPHADEFWRPSIHDMIRLAALEMARQGRELETAPTLTNEYLTSSQRRMTPPQIEQLLFVSRKMREMRDDGEPTR